MSHCSQSVGTAALLAHHSVAMAEREAKRQKTEKELCGSSRPMAGLCSPYIPKMEDREFVVVDKRGKRCVALVECDRFRIYLDPRNFCNFPFADARIVHYIYPPLWMAHLRMTTMAQTMATIVEDVQQRKPSNIHQISSNFTSALPGG